MLLSFTNKLLRTDLIILVALLLLFFLRSDLIRSVLDGMLAVGILFSIGNHITYYKKSKKLY